MQQVSPPSPQFRRVTSFRSRRSALSESQRQVWDRLWPQLGMDVGNNDVGNSMENTINIGGDAGGNTHNQARQCLDGPTWWGRHAPLVVEIGCGTGTSTLAMAATEPHINVAAVEVYRRGLAQLLCAIDRAQAPHIRLIRGDGLDVLEQVVSTQSLTGVRVFFPDPWPKARHHKRRFLQPRTMALIADRLRPGGVLHAATDHAGYASQIAEVGDSEPLLRRVHPGEPLPISVARPVTKYERKAQQVGSVITELLWIRQS